MSKAISALGGKSSTGFVAVSDAGLQGMITLRGDLKSAKVKKAVKAVTGCEMPEMRRIVEKAGKAAAWLSPDELLLLVPYVDVQAAVAALEKALAAEHALVADVSDARAMFRIKGDKADEALMKLCPVDFSSLAEGEIRRTRAAQVAAALWKSAADEFTLVSFRSVGAYVFGTLEVSSRPGAEIF
ncbi:MAG: sarcosine oxidase subunit gamma family protein [Paracoccaceae bacterium]